MEKDKLVGWALLMNISDGDESVGSSMRLNTHAIINALREIQVLLLDFAQLDKRYKLQFTVATEKPATKTRTYQTSGEKTLGEGYAVLQQKALDFIDKTRKYPKKLQWAAFDKARFESLLSNLRMLNDDMAGFLESYERNRHFKLQELTFLQILQVNNRMSDLFELLRAFQGSAAGQDSGRMGNSSDDTRKRAYNERIIRLTRFKAMNIATEDLATQTDGDAAGTNSVLTEAATKSELELSKLSQIPLNDEDEEYQRSPAIYDNVPVWVEWRYYEGVGEDERPPGFLEERISKLAKLLRDGMKPAEFLVPDCFGYVHDSAFCRFGFVYKSAESLGAGLPVSLLQLLEIQKKPSLTTRMRIARVVATSIWYLHATNWLHKGLRSENIVFQDRAQIRTASPFLCGFDYSRPSGVGEETEPPSKDYRHELYRHPETQFEVPREDRGGFKKEYDIYSLGVVLFEIGMWMPIHDILGLDSRRPNRTLRTKNAQSILLQDQSLESLESEAGDIYTAAVKMCLGNSVEDRILGGLEGDSQLHVSLAQHVVEKLECISI
ncbi:Fc.00g022990.m01.CDS01 [Cosmosporella sp. VM-42]